jgi:hypothetical protein
VVYGIEKFKEYFRDYTGCYVFIGGIACDMIMESYDLKFRTTKDFDLVLIMETVTTQFGETLWKFIKDGQYEKILKSNGKNNLYRFIDPKINGFPVMIELFSRNDLFAEIGTGRLIPIHISDNISSLSAILLNNEYYDVLNKGKKELQGVSVLSEEYLILFKIKAWLDLNDRKRKGEKIDSNDIKKHKNDIFRLLMIVEPDTKVVLNKILLNDVNTFINQIKNEPFDLKNIGTRAINFSDAVELILKIYIT